MTAPAETTAPDFQFVNDGELSDRAVEALAALLLELDDRQEEPQQ